jgi:hypothetical protein
MTDERSTYGPWDADVTDVQRELRDVMKDVRELKAELLREKARADEAVKDVKRMDWLDEHGATMGGGKGFEFRVWIPADEECFRTAIDAAISSEQSKEGK